MMGDYIVRLLLVYIISIVVSVRGDKCKIQQEPPPAPSLTALFPPTRFDKAFVNIWAPDHLNVSHDKEHVALTLDHSSGTGFKSTSTYLHGLFNAAIKLPVNKYTAGVVTTFYLSNGEIYPNSHDEVGFEFLGRAEGEKHIVQTHISINGSTKIGREQRFRLWFDPTASYHCYTILWTSKHIVFFIDDTAIREIPFAKLGDGQYLTKEMHLYGTILDASDWATDAGQYRVDYTYAPFIAHYSQFILNGCRPKKVTLWAMNIEATSRLDCDCEFSTLIPARLSREQRRGIAWVEQYSMTYNYCDDKQRYPEGLPECSLSLLDDS